MFEQISKHQEDSTGLLVNIFRDTTHQNTNKLYILTEQARSITHKDVHGFLHYHCSSSFVVRIKPHAILAVAERVPRYPLVCILSSLCSHAFTSWTTSKRHLKPLAVPAVAYAPWPAVIQPAVPGSQVVIVVTWGREGTWDQAAVFGTKRHSTSVCREET